MTRARKILVATDLSAPARHAVERAFHLAAVATSELCVLHVMELDALDSLREMLGGDVTAVRTALGEDARQRLEQLVGTPAICRGLAATTKIANGSPIATIAAEAEAQVADLIVLGARGESFLRHEFMGSTAVRLLRKTSRRPVLVVKQAPHEPYRSVLIPVDFSPASLQAIRYARQWAPKAGLVLLHAFELPYEGKLTYAGVDERDIRQYIADSSEIRKRRLHDLAAAAGLTSVDYSGLVIHGDPSQQIVLMEQEIDADLIVIGKHGLHVVEELLLGSVTKHVLAESQCDVMVICDPREPPELLS